MDEFSTTTATHETDEDILTCTASDEALEAAAGGREVQRKQWLALATNPPGANPANTLDQTDEDILTPTVSDEALEAAAGTEVGTTLYPWNGPTVFASLAADWRLAVPSFGGEPS